MTAPVELIAASDLTDHEYRTLESIVVDVGNFAEPRLFRARVRHVAHVLIVQTALREGGAGGFYQRMADDFRGEIDALERARRIIGPETETGRGLAAAIAAKRGNIAFLGRLPGDSRSKPEIALAVRSLTEIFGHHSGTPISDLSPGARSEEYPNAVCRFVRSALAIMQVNLSHDRVWKLVSEALHT